MTNNKLDFAGCAAIVLITVNAGMLFPAAFGLLISAALMFAEPLTGLLMFAATVAGIWLFFGYVRRAGIIPHSNPGAWKLWGGTMLYNVAGASFVAYLAGDSLLREPYFLGVIGWQLATFVLASLALRKDLRSMNE